MTRKFNILVLLLLVLLMIGTVPQGFSGRGAVASDHSLVSAAGAQLLARGGNAVDAAVAMALAAGVAQPAGSGLGGGGFAVVRFVGREPFVLDFRERAPAAASRDMFRRGDGRVDSAVSRRGGLAVGVPGEPAGLSVLLARFGRLSRSEVVGPAVTLAREGFVMQPHLASALTHTHYASVIALFRGPTGRPAEAGERVVRPELAATLERWGADPTQLLEGKDAATIVDAVQAAGGVLVRTDLAAYAPVERTPIVFKWRDYTIITMPPPSSGGIVLGQVLGAVEDVDLQGLGHNSVAYIHRLAEAMKHAYADRAHHLGDPDFVDVPTARLLGAEHITAIRDDFSSEHTWPANHYGSLIVPPVDGGTQHISVIDAAGNAVALTTTINTSFGSGVVDPATGIVLNNEMDDFAAAPGVPNYFGLVGNAANAVAPGKRPLSSMTPTLVLNRSGQVVLSVGASGGSYIISSTVQALLNRLVFGMPPQEAVAAGRVHHQWQPDVLWVEPSLPMSTRTALSALGHEVKVMKGGFYSSVQMVVSDGVRREGGADPRKGGRAVTVP